jgi:hypothetical protein
MNGQPITAMDALRLKALQTYQRTKNIVLERSAPVVSV